MTVTVACVRSGTRYSPEYVTKLRRMVARHLPLPHEFVCFTDQPEREHGIRYVDITHLALPKWWGKLGVFDPSMRGPHRTLFFDLDTVIVGDLTPLAQWGGVFGICENFTRLSGHSDWPCLYGSCVMSFAPDWGESVWRKFWLHRDRYMVEYPRGDQQAIEHLYPYARLLQDEMPPGYFVGRREFGETKPEGAAVVVFAGSHKPHNTPYQWLREAWA